MKSSEHFKTLQETATKVQEDCRKKIQIVEEEYANKFIKIQTQF